MSNPVRYFDLIREMKNAFNHRLRLVTYARPQGIKPAARAFRTTVATVRKGLRRYAGQGLKGLQELSRAPRTPRRTRSSGSWPSGWRTLSLESLLADPASPTS